MAKHYSGNSIEKLNELEPKQETVNFILNYSKTLAVINCASLKTEILLN